MNKLVFKPKTVLLILKGMALEIQISLLTAALFKMAI